jgi:hypothetical protein
MQRNRFISRWLRLLCLALVASAVVQAANQRLYLTDGSFHVVREYQVLSDRVRFYSVERSAWEEIPLDLIDLKKTRELNEAEQAEAAEEQQMIDAEEAVEQRLRKEARGIPAETGVYLYEEGKLRTFPMADLEVANDRKRSILKAINPLPMTAGRNFVEMKGLRSPHVVRTERPEFYFRLDRQQMFGFVRVSRHKENRLLQVWEIIPVSKQIIETQEDLEDFRREAGPLLYQLWPRNPLEPGQYALVTYSPGEANVRAWDFAYAAEGEAPEAREAEKPKKEKDKK